MRISKALATRLSWPLAAALVGAGLCGTAPAPAQTAAPSATLQVNTGRGRLITLPHPMSDVFVADESIADVQVRSPTQLYVFGKKAGETTVSATAKNGAVVYGATIRVGNNFDSIGQMLSLAMPEDQISATTFNGMVLLTGTVLAPQDAAEAEKLVQAFVGDQTKVISHLKSATPLQVSLHVKIAEVSRSFVKNIGMNLQNRQNGHSTLFNIAQGKQGSISTVTGNPVAGYVNGAPVDASGAPIAATTSGLLPGATQYSFPAAIASGTSLGLAGHALGMDLLGQLDLGETIGQVTTLAEPNMTVVSGETSSFLAGGEIPIPVSQGLGAVSVEYKQYGVSLSYTPTVLSDGRISIRVRAESSQLSSAGAVTISGTSIPALTTRRTETTVELGSGQSLPIAGLLQNDHNNSITKAPGLADLPILGTLFRSNGWQRNETELVIVVTPYLVKPVNANDIALPTDGYKSPSDVQRVLLGKLSDGESGGSRPKPTMAAPGVAPAVGAADAPSPGVPAPFAATDTSDTRDKPKRAKPAKGAAANPGFGLN